MPIMPPQFPVSQEPQLLTGDVCIEKLEFQIIISIMSSLIIDYLLDFEIHTSFPELGSVPSEQEHQRPSNWLSSVSGNRKECCVPSLRCKCLALLFPVRYKRYSKCSLRSEKLSDIRNWRIYPSPKVVRSHPNTRGRVFYQWWKIQKKCKLWSAFFARCLFVGVCSLHRSWKFVSFVLVVDHPVDFRI